MLLTELFSTKEKVKWSHKMHPRPQTEYILAEQEETAMKRPRLMEARPERDQTSTSVGQEDESMVSNEKLGDWDQLLYWFSMYVYLVLVFSCLILL